MVTHTTINTTTIATSTPGLSLLSICEVERVGELVNAVMELAELVTAVMLTSADMIGSMEDIELVTAVDVLGSGERIGIVKSVLKIYPDEVTVWLTD